MTHPSQESEMRSDDPVEVDYSFLNDDRPYLPDRGKSPCGFDHAILREQAATEVRRELDVEVLGRAFDLNGINWPARWGDNDFAWLARQVAAEYRRLIEAEEPR